MEPPPSPESEDLQASRTMPRTLFLSNNLQKTEKSDNPIYFSRRKNRL